MECRATSQALCCKTLLLTPTTNSPNGVVWETGSSHGPPLPHLFLYPGPLVIPIFLDSSHKAKCWGTRAQPLVRLGTQPPPGERAQESPQEDDTSHRGKPQGPWPAVGQTQLTAGAG